MTVTEGPPTQNDVGNVVGSGEMGNFAMAWSMQMGLTKYAAMQTHPPTKITKKTKTPLYPTSPYTLATTFLGRPTIQTTVMEPVTWSFSQRENPVCTNCRTSTRQSLIIIPYFSCPRPLRQYAEVLEQVERFDQQTAESQPHKLAPARPSRILALRDRERYNDPRSSGADCRIRDISLVRQERGHAVEHGRGESLL